MIEFEINVHAIVFPSLFLCDWDGIELTFADCNRLFANGQVDEKRLNGNASQHNNSTIAIRNYREKERERDKKKRSLDTTRGPRARFYFPCNYPILAELRDGRIIRARGIKARPLSFS